MGKFADLGHDRARELLNRIPAEFRELDELCELLHIIDCHYKNVAGKPNASALG